MFWSRRIGKLIRSAINSGLEDKMKITADLRKSHLAGLLVIFLITAVSVAGIVGVNSHTASDETKVAVIILDGSDWKPVNQLREQDRVPEIERTIQNGVYGNLTAPRAWSPISWTKVATGRTDEHLNVKGWNTEGEYGRRMVRQEDVQHKRIWDYLNKANYSTGVVSWLLTWPVEKVNGFMISGPMRTDNRDFAYPMEEFNETEKEIILDGNEWKEAEMGIRRKEEVDFLALGMKNLDVIQHHLWKYVDSEAFGLKEEPGNEEYRETIYAEYENLDSVMQEFGEDWNIIVFGTSGFRPENEIRGWIGPSYAQSINPLIEYLGYGEFEKKTIRGTTIDEPKSGTQMERCPLNHAKYGGDIVNRTTQRFQICILNESLDVEQAMNDLKSIKYRDGRDLIHKLEYYREEDVIIGEKRIFSDGIVEEKHRMAPTDQPLVDGPVSYIDPALGIVLPNGTKKKLWIGPEKNGDHPPGTDSVFLARGPAFKENYEIDQGELYTYDIAPTILYMYGLPIPADMEGEPYLEMFTEEFQSQRELRYVNSSTEKNKTYPAKADKTRNKVLKQRLRDIGYLVG